MTLGCPVIASNTSSLPEVLGDACSYFDPTSIDDMAAKIDQLLNDQAKLESLKAKGYQQARKYDWEKSALQLTKIITQYNA